MGLLLADPYACHASLPPMTRENRTLLRRCAFAITLLSQRQQLRCKCSVDVNLTTEMLTNIRSLYRSQTIRLPAVVGLTAVAAWNRGDGQTMNCGDGQAGIRVDSMMGLWKRRKVRLGFAPTPQVALTAVAADYDTSGCMCFSCAHCVIICCLTALSVVKAMAAFILCRLGICLL